MELTITDQAAVELKKAMATEPQSQVAGLRLGVMEDGCCGARYTLSLAETVSESEAMAESQGIKVFVARESADSLKGTVIDYVHTPMGSGFHISRAGGEEHEHGGGHGHGHGHGQGHGHGSGGCACGGAGGCGSGGGCAC